MLCARSVAPLDQARYCPLSSALRRRQFNMRVRTTIFALVLATATAVVPPSESCCLWGGNGAGYAQGLGTFALPTGGAKPAILPIAIAASGRDAEAPFMTIRIAPDAHSADSVLGWHITQNATAQTTVAWIRVAGMVCFSCCVRHCRDRKTAFLPSAPLATAIARDNHRRLRASPTLYRCRAPTRLVSRCVQAGQTRSSQFTSDLMRSTRRPSTFLHRQQA